MSRYILTPDMVRKIAKILESGDRVELIPGKYTVKVVQESRKEVK